MTCFFLHMPSISAFTIVKLVQPHFPQNFSQLQLKITPREDHMAEKPSKLISNSQTLKFYFYASFRTQSLYYFKIMNKVFDTHFKLC